MFTRLMVAGLIVALSGEATTQRTQGNRPTPTVSQAIQGLQKIEGFFNLYWDASQERMLLEIAADRWDQEFLYVTSTPANVSGSNRGSLGGTQILKFSREASKIFMIQSNYTYRAQTEDEAEQRAVTEAYYPSINRGFRIHAEENGQVLIDATDFFMGGGDRARSSFYWPHTRGFPKNTEVEVTVTTTGGGGGGAGAGARGGRRGGGGGGGARTVRRHHSLIELPDNNFEPRKYDQRAGIGSIRFMDYATPITEDINVRYASRHRLQKKDPTAAVSEAVEPIVYYIDPGAPEPVRSALVEGASWWNQAFEAIGYKNAFRAEVLPPGADPMDLRYNMIQWIHRPSRGWSSGSSVRDPRTGEIIAGRVFLGSQRVRQDFLIGTGLHAPYGGDQPDTARIEEMVLARTRQLSAHEVGHTLGFSHNFAASTRGRESVMDYPHPTLRVTEDGTIDFSDTYDIGIGEWDKVTVAYGYSHFPPGTDEDKALDEILNSAHSRGLFWNQSVGANSASPDTHQWDNGSNALAEFENVARIRQIAIANMSENNIPMGAPLQSIEEVLVPIYLYHRYQIEAVSKSIGGLDYRFAVRGDRQLITQVVPGNVQRQALDAVLSTIQPSFLEVPAHIRNLIPPRTGGGGEVFPRHTSPSFDPLSAAETATNHSVSFLLNANRAARLIHQHALDYDIPSLGEVIDRLLDQTWRRTLPTSRYHAEIARSVDDVTLHRLMGLAATPGAATQVRAIASLKLEELNGWLSREISRTHDESQRAHYYFGQQQITHFQADPTKFQLSDPATAPAGAPIGMGQFPLPGIVCDWQDW